MHLRKLTFIVGFLGALCCMGAHGLGLGEITLNSNLNQPLDAEIKLLQVRDLAEEDILIELAASEDFERFGVDRVFFLQRLDFDVQLDHPDGPLVKVTTDDPVREPYLVFLLEARSPGGGRLLREYTLLMDVPVFADESAQPVEGAQTAPEPAQSQRPAEAQPQPEPRQQAQEPPRAEPRPEERRQGEPPRAEPAPDRSVSSARPDGGMDGDTYGVQANDTLWEIALRVRPSANASVQQTMLALQRLNPDAFIDNNINMLKRGQVLRIPDQGEIETLDQQSAVNQVASQNSRWSEERGGQVAGAELEASRARPTEQTSDQSRRGELTLAAPGDDQGAGDRSGTGDTSARSEALENELAITAEELDAARRENEELSSRVDELEEQIATMERLIEVSNEEMRALQLAAEGGEEAESAQAEQVAAEEEEQDVAAEAGAAAAETSEEQSQASDPSGANEPEDPEPAVAQPERTVVSQQAPEPSLVDLLMANLWYMLIALLAVLGGVVYFLHRRTQAELASFDNMDDDDMFGDGGDEPTDTGFMDDGADFNGQMEAEPDDYQTAVEEEEEPDLSVEPETGDAVAEADIYIAYGKFDQAEEMLRNALVNDPNDVDARLKLLEVYTDTKDVEKFDREYGQLMAMGDTAATSRAAELRSSIPGAGQFGGEASGEGESQPAAGLDQGGSGEPGEGFNFDGGEPDGGELSLDMEASPSGGHETAEAGDTLGDLSLDLDDDGSDTAASAQEKDAGEETAFDFNFDLDDGEDQSGGEENDDGAFDLSEEFTAADANAEESDKASAFSTQSDQARDDTGGLEFSLDLDGDPSSESETDLPAFGESDRDEASGGDDGELSLDLDLGEEDSTADSELSLDLGDDSLADSGKALDSDDDILSDLEFSATTLTDEASDSEVGASRSEPADTAAEAGKAPGAESSADDDDDFDMDMGDLDLKALDREMDALVGDIDDPSDDDVAVAPPTETAPVLDEKTAAAVDEDFSLDDLASDGDDSDWSASPKSSVNNSANAFAFDENQEAGVDEDLDSELDFLADTDEVATKLDLARAYIDMGDQDGAKDILDEVSSEGNDEQKREAGELLGKIV